jgi:hypothetical protein
MSKQNQELSYPVEGRWVSIKDDGMAEKDETKTGLLIMDNAR